MTGRLSRSSTRYAEVIRPSGYVCWVESGERPRRTRVQILGELTGRGVSTTWCETALKRNKTRKLNPAVVLPCVGPLEGGRTHRRLPRAAECLTKDTPAWYAGTRARVEARAALEQAEELRRMLEEVGERSRQ